jgi:ubiquinone/menaquinone biosynthesis C-methylase UbiE
MEKNKKTFAASTLGVKFINPEDVIASLDFRNGMKVANFGCGTGYFAIPVAKKIGPDGTVFALDVRAEKLEVVESQAKLFGLTNITARRANLEIEKGSELPDASMDWVIIANMLFQNSNKNAILSEAKRVLKKKGKILVVEWNEKDFPIGPSNKIKISREEMAKIAGKNNLKIAREVEASNFHYGLILEKQK